MVLTRRKRKELGIPLNEEDIQETSKEKQTKITSYYQPKMNAITINDKIDLKENLSFENLLMEWDIDKIPSWLPSNEEKNSILNLAQEMEEAENVGITHDLLPCINQSGTSLPDEEDSMPPLESSGSYEDFKINSQSFMSIAGKENEHEQIKIQTIPINDDWCQMVSQSLMQIAKFVAEANSLLTTLTELTVKQVIQTDSDTKNKNAATQTSHSDQRIDHLPLKKKEISSKPPMQTAKKSKNIKSIRSHRKCHLKFEKLFKLLDTEKTSPKEKKRKRKRKKKTKKKSTELKSIVPSSEGKSQLILEQDTQRLSSPKSIQANSNFNVNEQAPKEHLIMNPDNEFSSYSIKNNRDWNLILNENQLALINYPKPVGYLTQNERKRHLTNIVNKVSPGLVQTKDIINIKYLFYNYISARAIVTFASKEKLSLFQHKRELMVTQNIYTARIFDNQVPPKSLMSRHFISERILTQHEVDARESDILNQSIIEIKSMEATKFLPEEISLLETFTTLSSEARSEIRFKLENLLTTVKEMDCEHEIGNINIPVATEKITQGVSELSRTNRENKIEKVYQHIPSDALERERRLSNLNTN
ncbi:uncharacterized protein LOC133388658 [Rhineura floridana]|uniref:uncharacterized protein LOC133388658 n=1 Tax=Rhineura floridana TaxID=261503 RepID=UPI002AC87058|nr:uncharacterized protein LOC133388658 [Rhineura floridana]